MRVLVIGSEGNVGKELVPYLRECGHVVYRIDIIQGFSNDYTIADIKNPNDLSSVFEKFKPEIVFNLAAMVSRITCEKSKCITVDTNLSGVFNIIQMCKVFGSKLIYFSTSEVYGNIENPLKETAICKPNNFYGLTKYLGEKIVEYEIKEGLDAIIVRPFMLYSEMENFGVNRSAMIRFAESLIKREKITVHTNTRRSWLHMSDAVVIFERLMHQKWTTPINVGNYKTQSMSEIANIMCSSLGIKYSEFVVEEDLPEKMTYDKTPDLSRQYYLTGYTPLIDIEDGINRVLTIAKKRLP